MHHPCQFEFLEPRRLFSTINYGVAASGDPDVTGVLAETGPGLKDLGATGVRLFTNTSFLSSDFDHTPGGTIYVRNPALITSLAYAKKYHDAGINVTLCIEISIDRSMQDGSLLIDKSTGEARKLTSEEVRSPKVFRTWFDTLSRAKISKTDRTSVTRVLDFWEIGNEPNNSKYWPIDTTVSGDARVFRQLDSYVDHELIPAYDVLSKLHEPVIGAPLASGTPAWYESLNNQAGARHHQYSDHCDYLNFHPYGYWNSPDATITPQAEVLNFTNAMYGDGTVNKPFVITEYNISDFSHVYPPDPNPNPRDSADQLASVKNLDAAHTSLLSNPEVKQRCAWIYYYRLIAVDIRTRGGLFYPPPQENGAYTPLPALYDMFKRWANGAPAAASPATVKGVVNLGVKAPINAIVLQKDGKTLVLSDDGVRRYDTQGKIDTAYGVNGFSALPFTGTAAAVQGDGNLIVGGSQTDTTPSSTPHHLVVTRLSTGGTIDKGFGTKGYFALKDGSASQVREIALRAGKIVIAGRSGGVQNGVLIRLDLTGQPDATFAGGGVTVLKHTGLFSGLAIAKSGAITTLLTPYKLLPQTSVVRFTASGALDTTFAADGISDAQPLFADGMFVDGDGSVLLVGHAPLARGQVLTRFTSTGAIDPAFGSRGIKVANKVIRGSSIEFPDGSRFLYGSIAPSLLSDTKHIFLAKLTTDGQFDPSYGTSGVRTLTSTNAQDLAFTAAIGADSVLRIAAGAFTQDENGGTTQELFFV